MNIANILSPLLTANMGIKMITQTSNTLKYYYLLPTLKQEPVVI